MPKEIKDDSPVNIASLLTKLGCECIDSLEAFESPFYFSSGLFSLDLILSAKGGFGVGCTEISGGEGTGKTSLILKAIEQHQLSPSANVEINFVNVEKGLTKGLIQCFNINPKLVNWINAPNGTVAINAMELILKSKPNQIVVLDSVPACIPETLYDKEAGEKSYSPVAGLFNDFMPKAKTYCQANGSILILLNQLRDNMDAGPYGPDDRVPGGRAIKFYCDTRLSLKKREMITKGQDADKVKLGHHIQAETIKNRFHRPYQRSNHYLIYGRGFNEGMEILELSLQFGIVKKSGAWFVYNEEKFQGTNQMAECINQNETVRKEIKSKIKEIIS